MRIEWNDLGGDFSRGQVFENGGRGKDRYLIQASYDGLELLWTLPSGDKELGRFKKMRDAKAAAQAHADAMGRSGRAMPRRFGNITGSPATKSGDARAALRALLTFVVSGRRYETRNPYTIPEVTNAFRALGLDWRGHGAQAKPRGVVDRALLALTEFVVSGRRYESRNPYTIPEVNAGFRALGLDQYGDRKR